MSQATSIAILALAFVAVAAQGTWSSESAALSRSEPEAGDLSAGDSLCSDEDVERLPYVDHEDDLSMRFRIPRHFDARKRWRFCPSIRSIREQSNCKAYYAMAVASVLSDRICIASRGRLRPELSAQNLLSCCTRCGTCQAGGCICMSWQFAHEHGLVTGGGYNSSRGCYPYEVRPCGDLPGQEGCPAELPTASACQESACTNAGYRTPFAKDVHRAGTPYRVANTTAAIQAEILKHGPVSALMRYDNKFLRYSGGIYRRDDSDLIAATTLRVIGWGHTRSHGAYWLAANSWGRKWGEKGTVRIAMRADNFINNHVQTAHPDFHHSGL